jgi:hypothetical protein
MKKSTKVILGKSLAVAGGLFSIYKYAKGMTKWILEICNTIDENNK